jgi:hypothetical protein
VWWGTVKIVEILSPKLRKTILPVYRALNFNERPILDLKASGLGPASCSSCQSPVKPLRGALPSRFVFLEGAHPGALFALSNVMTRSWFCTEDVIDLACREGWTNFFFEPADLEGDTPLGWKGIDYRDPNWRARQYPIDPLAGRSPAELILDLTCKDGKQSLAATWKLAARGTRVLPILCRRLLEATNPIHQYRLATLVMGIASKHGRTLPSRVKDRLAKCLKRELR